MFKSRPFDFIDNTALFAKLTLEHRTTVLIVDESSSGKLLLAILCLSFPLACPSQDGVHMVFPTGKLFPHYSSLCHERTDILHSLAQP